MKIGNEMKNKIRLTLILAVFCLASSSVGVFATDGGEEVDKLPTVTKPLTFSIILLTGERPMITMDMGDSFETFKKRIGAKIKQPENSFDIMFRGKVLNRETYDSTEKKEFGNNIHILIKRG